MKITSFGGAGEVTGSKHLLEINGQRILLDCGLFQGRREESGIKNRKLGFDPATIDTVILSHAHIDHSGLLPMLVKQGFRGNIYTTHATRDLCSIMLLDSAHIQERDAEWLSKKKMAFIAPPYDVDDVQETMRRFVCISYEMRLPIGNDIFLTLHDAGHVLGSAMVELHYKENDQWRTFIFSGDIGRNNTPILEDPWQPTDAHVVMMESTYGNRDHKPIEAVEAKLQQIIQETYGRGGKLIIPTFALERAQEVIYALKCLEAKGAIPKQPVYVDSPLTVNITEIFRLHTEEFDKEFREVMQNAGNPFELEDIHYIRALSDSMKLNDLKGPAIILSASGMCEFGRIVHHLRNHCEHPENTILIVGFQAQHTLGRRIVERQRQIRIFGKMHDLNAQVKIMNEFSAHAGRQDLIKFGSQFNGSLEKLILVHGESDAQTALKADLEAAGVQDIHIQEPKATIKV